jgi:hypothetical protein
MKIKILLLKELLIKIINWDALEIFLLIKVIKINLFEIILVIFSLKILLNLLKKDIQIAMGLLILLHKMNESI